MLRDALENKQIKQLVDDILRRDAPLNQNSQALPGVFIQDGEYLEGSTIRGSGSHEIVAPDMVLMLRLKPDAGAIVEPEPSSLRLFLGLDGPIRLITQYRIFHRGRDAPAWINCVAVWFTRIGGAVLLIAALASGILATIS